MGTTPALSRGVDPRSIMNLFFLHVLAPAAAAVHLEQKRIYRKTHHNHPCARWVRSHKANYVWACDLGLALCEEYTHRYEKEHKTKSVLTFCRDNVPAGIASFAIPPTSDNPSGLSLPIPQAMPETYRVGEVLPKCLACETEFRVLEQPQYMRTSKRKKAELAAGVTTTTKWSRVECGEANETSFDLGVANTIQAYRQYYQGDEKASLQSWRKRSRPEWFQ